MHIRPIVLILLLAASVRASAQGTYFTRYDIQDHWAGALVPGPAGSFYGTTRHMMGTPTDLYKVGEDGDMLWCLEVAFSTAMTPIRSVALSDGTFAVLAQDLNYQQYVMKVSDAGEILWVERMVISSPASLNSLAATTDGGLMLTGSGCMGANMILHLDAQGAIMSQSGHQSPYSEYAWPNGIDMVHDGENQYSYLGYASDADTEYLPVAFFRSDSSGYVYSYRELHFPYGQSRYWSLGRHIDRSPDGGHFIVVRSADSLQVHFIVFHLNAQDELVWCKDIMGTGDYLYVAGLCATEDGGCVVAVDNNMAPGIITNGSLVMRFNPQGEVTWSKMVGDADGGPVYVRQLVRAANGGFLTVPTSGSLPGLCRVDNAFEGYCASADVLPVIEDLEPTVLEYEIYATNIAYSTQDVEWLSVMKERTRTDLCADNSVAEAGVTGSLRLAVDPAAEQVRIWPWLESTVPVEVRVYNAMGALLLAHQAVAAPGGELTIATTGFSAGIHVLDVRSGNSAQRATFVLPE